MDRNDYPEYYPPLSNVVPSPYANPINTNDPAHIQSNAAFDDYNFDADSPYTNPYATPYCAQENGYIPPLYNQTNQKYVDNKYQINYESADSENESRGDRSDLSNNGDPASKKRNKHSSHKSSSKKQSSNNSAHNPDFLSAPNDPNIGSLPPINPSPPIYPPQNYPLSNGQTDLPNQDRVAQIAPNDQSIDNGRQNIPSHEHILPPNRYPDQSQMSANFYPQPQYIYDPESPAQDCDNGSRRNRRRRSSNANDIEEIRNEDESSNDAPPTCLRCCVTCCAGYCICYLVIFVIFMFGGIIGGVMGTS
ncbi:hypothetical protein TRFO_03935 [Tritrichomonas foetus]|uniref:Uncharacterized protein n=1 Tax=Tritrichomonas foetus TaxID=1144522 RepID=A0A1J4KKM3_9EUKA|nr:hypothetical protein TRFO_03935 [Tritrichomonas foetus]|eukprot:OHT11690.1 hypothetical protein TRFO_03935 [Tritrichomonas foetus]